MAFSDEERAHAQWLFAQPWHFVRGVPTLDFLPDADRPEIAFAGRSNVGKSSLINALVNQHGLARTSNTPGRTQELNFFATPAAPFYIVDLPGYGYAQAPKPQVDAWQRLLRAYLRGRDVLRMTCLLIDARHGPKEIDRAFMTMLGEAAVAYRVVLTKADAVSAGALTDTVADLRRELMRKPGAHPEPVVTSVRAGVGIDELRAALAALAVAAVGS